MANPEWTDPGDYGGRYTCRSCSQPTDNDSDVCDQCEQGARSDARPAAKEADRPIWRCAGCATETSCDCPTSVQTRIVGGKWESRWKPAALIDDESIEAMRLAVTHLLYAIDRGYFGNVIGLADSAFVTPLRQYAIPGFAPVLPINVESA